MPLQPGYSYAQVRLFGEGIARVLVRENKSIATVERSVSNRGGKVYLDYLQNARSQSVCAPYVPRPVPGASVSMPLEWDELDGSLALRDFNIESAPERIARLGDLFRGVLSEGQDLLPAVAALEQAIAEG